MIRFPLGVPLLLWAILGSAQDLKEFEKKVTEFSLANGLHFIVVERHEAPVVSCHTYVNAGSANDAAGQTGVANLAGRMALKGTETVGTRDWAAGRRRSPRSRKSITARKRSAARACGPTPPR